jgi:hypothetical protein
LGTENSIRVRAVSGRKHGRTGSSLRVARFGISANSFGRIHSFHLSAVEISSSELIKHLPALPAVSSLVALWLIRGKAGAGKFFAAAYFVISLFPSALGFFNVSPFDSHS